VIDAVVTDAPDVIVEDTVDQDVIVDTVENTVDVTEDTIDVEENTEDLALTNVSRRHLRS
jgi:hypothetical protein